MSRTATCPHCSTRFEVAEANADRVLFCPHCQAEVGISQAEIPIQAANLNTDVRRDWTKGGIVLAVLISLCILGVAASLVISFRSNQSSDGLGLLALCCFALDIVASIAIIRWGVCGVRTPSVGRALGVVFMVIGTTLAIFIFFFFTCLDLAFRGPFH